jgi:hypothetical protein
MLNFETKFNGTTRIKSNKKNRNQLICNSNRNLTRVMKTKVDSYNSNNNNNNINNNSNNYNKNNNNKTTL